MERAPASVTVPRMPAQPRTKTPALVGRISRFKTGDLVVSIKGCKDVKKADLCSASYVTKEIVMVVPDYPKDVPVEKPKF